MKIADVRTIALSCRCDPPYASAAGVQAQRAALLVEIETDNGIVGIGEAGIGGGVTASVVEKNLKPLLVGEDPLLIEHLWQKMFARTRFACDQRHRYRAVGYRWQGHQIARVQIARRQP